MPASKYYYLKPTMPMYWKAVGTMVNAIAVNTRMIGDCSSAYELMLRGDPMTEHVTEKNYQEKYNADGTPIQDAKTGGRNITLNRDSTNEELAAQINKLTSTYAKYTDIYNGVGQIDIYKVACRAQHRHNRLKRFTGQRIK